MFPEQPIWGALQSPFTFIITQDAPDGFSASVKQLGAKPHDGTRYDLGGFCGHKTYASAVAACEKFFKERNA